MTINNNSSADRRALILESKTKINVRVLFERNKVPASTTSKPDKLAIEILYYIQYCRL